MHIWGKLKLKISQFELLLFLASWPVVNKHEFQALPGIMLLPGSFSGRDSSPSPQRGPDPRNLISFAIFIKLQAITFSAP